MIRVIAPLRGCDPLGCGHFGASRGSREHQGIDFEVVPGSEVLSPVNGEVTKLGFTYGDDLRFRYVQVTDHRGFDHRLFYVSPEVEFGESVTKEDVIGFAQDVKSYHGEKIKSHIHYEIKNSQGVVVDPDHYHCD